MKILQVIRDQLYHGEPDTGPARRSLLVKISPQRKASRCCRIRQDQDSRFPLKQLDDPAVVSAGEVHGVTDLGIGASGQTAIAREAGDKRLLTVLDAGFENGDAARRVDLRFARLKVLLRLAHGSLLRIPHRVRHGAA